MTGGAAQRTVVPAMGSLMFGAEIKAEIDDHGPEPSLNRGKAAQELLHVSVRDQIPACADAAVSLLSSKNAAAFATRS